MAFCGSRSLRGTILTRGALAVARNLKLKAKFESSSSERSFKRLNQARSMWGQTTWGQSAPLCLASEPSGYVCTSMKGLSQRCSHAKHTTLSCRPSTPSNRVRPKVLATSCVSIELKRRGSKLWRMTWQTICQALPSNHSRK
jgi:hypothetical protein